MTFNSGKAMSLRRHPFIRSVCPSRSSSAERLQTTRAKGNVSQQGSKGPPTSVRPELQTENSQTIGIGNRIAVFTIEELETGLRMLGREDVDLNAFWDQNIVAFRQTVLLAIRETSDALLSPGMTLRWRIEMEDQLEDLARYIKLADLYLARRFPDDDAPSAQQQPIRPSVH